MTLKKPSNDLGIYILKNQVVSRGVRCPVIPDLDYFGPRLFRTGDFGRQSVISDGDFGRCAVKSDGDFGRCAVNSDAQLSSLLYHYFGTNIGNFGW